MTTCSLPFLFLLTFLLVVGSVQCSPNYREALAKSLLFFQGQRSGRLPPNQQLKWRSSSGLSDGRLANVIINSILLSSSSFSMCEITFCLITFIKLNWYMQFNNYTTTHTSSHISIFSYCMNIF